MHRTTRKPIYVDAEKGKGIKTFVYMDSQKRTNDAWLPEKIYKKGLSGIILGIP